MPVAGRSVGGALAAILGREGLREDDAARAAASVDGEVPRWVARPATPEQVSGVLALAHDAGLAVAPRGSGSALELGRPPAAEVPLVKECYVAPETATAFAEAAAFLEAKYRVYRSWEQDRALPAGERWSPSFEELARDRFVIGDPVRVAEEIARYRERLGVTTLIVRLQWPGMGHAEVLRSIRLLGEKVLPRFA